MRILLSSRSVADLKEIYAYTVSTWGEDQARAYSEMLAGRMASLAENPSRGAPLDHVRSGMRRLPAGSHFIFYVMRKNHVTIVRVMHHARDHGRHLG